MYDVFVVHFEEGAQQLSHDEFLLFDHYFLGQFLFEGEGELLHFQVVGRVSLEEVVVGDDVGTVQGFEKRYFVAESFFCFLVASHGFLIEGFQSEGGLIFGGSEIDLCEGALSNQLKGSAEIVQSFDG